MALFDYKCVECGHKIEDVIEPYTENPAPKPCPKCGKDAVRVDFYQTWFALKGTGWSYGPSNCNNFSVGGK